MIKRELISKIGFFASGIISMSPFMSPNSGFPEATRKYGVRTYTDDYIKISFDEFPVHNVNNKESNNSKNTKNNITRLFSNKIDNQLKSIYEYNNQKNIENEPGIVIKIDKNKYTEHADDSYNFIHTVIKKQNNNKWMNDISKKIIPDDLDAEVESILNFCQDIHYRRDWHTTDSIEYSRHPVETLVDLVGDCVDKTILTYGFLESKGYEPGYVTLPGHVAPIVPIEYLHKSTEINKNGVLKINGSNYAFLESTGYDDEPTETDYTMDDIFYSYTRRDGINIHNASNIPDHVYNMIKNINENWS